MQCARGLWRGPSVQCLIGRQKERPNIHNGKLSDRGDDLGIKLADGRTAYLATMRGLCRALTCRRCVSHSRSSALAIDNSGKLVSDYSRYSQYQQPLRPARVRLRMTSFRNMRTEGELSHARLDIGEPLVEEHTNRIWLTLRVRSMKNSAGTNMSI